MSNSPFRRSILAGRARTVGVTGGAVLLLTAAGLYVARSQRSAVLVLEPTQGLTVKLNGREEKGERTERGIRIGVLAGQYKLEIRRPEYAPYSQDVRVPAGTTLTVRPVFTVLPAPSSARTDVSAVRVVQGRNAVFYLSDARSRLYRLEAGNSVPYPITSEALRDVRGIEWPADPRLALIVQGDGTYLQEIPFADLLGRQRLIKVAGPELISPKWDPQGGNSRIAAALFNAAGERRLVFVDPRIQRLERTADLSGFKAPRLSWYPDGSRVAVWDSDPDPALKRVWIYRLSDGSFGPVGAEGKVLEASASPDSTVLLVERENGTYAVAADGSESGQLLPTKLSGSSWKGPHLLYALGGNRDLLAVDAKARTSKSIYSFPGEQPVRGVATFDGSEALVFYTDDAVYTVDLGG